MNCSVEILFFFSFFFFSSFLCTPPYPLKNGAARNYVGRSAPGVRRPILKGGKYGLRPEGRGCSGPGVSR